MRNTGLLISIVAATFFCPQSVSACFCGSPDLSQSIIKAKAIFSAKAVAVSAKEAIFDVEEVWKGAATKKITLHRDQSSCELDFSVGETYLIYARQYKDLFSGGWRWVTSQCDRSRKIEEGGEDVERLWRMRLHHWKKVL